MAAEENGVVSGTQSVEYLAHPEGTRRGFSILVNKLQFIVECTLVYNVACFFCLSIRLFNPSTFF